MRGHPRRGCGRWWIAASEGLCQVRALRPRHAPPSATRSTGGFDTAACSSSRVVRAAYGPGRAQLHTQAAQPASHGGALRNASRPSTRPARGAASSCSSACGGAGFRAGKSRCDGWWGVKRVLLLTLPHGFGLGRSSPHAKSAPCVPAWRVVIVILVGQPLRCNRHDLFVSGVRDAPEHEGVLEVGYEAVIGVAPTVSATSASE